MATENTTSDSSTDVEEVVGTSSRRDLVAKGAVAAAIAAVATGALGTKVHAANGDTMHVGESDTGTATTRLSGGTTFRVDNGTSHMNASLYGFATGSANSFYGVRGNNTGSTGAGVYGTMNGAGAAAVKGTSADGGTGVYGEHTGTSIGDGVYGKSEDGYGVRGDGSLADFIASGSGTVRISKAGTPGPTASGTVGTIARDADGALWYCYATDKWRELAGATSTGAFHAISPKRVYDSRAGQAPLTVAKGKLSPGSTRVIDCTVDAPEVPDTATAVVLNLTAANTTGLGNLAVYPDGSPAPTTSSINFTPGVNIANSTTSGCGPGAMVRVLAGGSTGADFIIDIVGYYV